MRRLLRVADLHNGVTLTMAEVLAPLSPDADELAWSILDLGEVVPQDDSDLDLGDVEERVFASPTGLQLTFGELTDFAARILQVIDGLFVACTDAASLPRRHDTDPVIAERADFVVAAVDSSFWLVGGPDAVLDRINERFRLVTEHDPETFALRD
jgi:hypothetical protein